MPKQIEIAREHNSSPDSILKKIVSLVEQLSLTYGFSFSEVISNPTGNGVNITGRGIEGSIIVENNQVLAKITLGFPASMVATRIRRETESKIDELILQSA